MGFNRALVSKDGTLPHPMRAGDGLLSNFNMTHFLIEVDAVLLVSQLAGGHIHQSSTLTSSVNYQLPTAAAILASDGFNAMDIGDNYSFIVTNGQVAAFSVIITLSTGITAFGGAGNTLSVAAGASRVFTLTKQSLTTMAIS